MEPKQKMSGTLCYSCNRVIYNPLREDFLCPKCQEKAIKLLSLIQGTLSEEINKEVSKFLNNEENT